MSGFPSFIEFFKALWGHDQFPWQSMLADRLVDGRWPRVLDLPTASGKTACMDAAIYALACQADRSLEGRTAPRRIWFVVDRRIVVDEAFRRAQCIACLLGAANGGPLAAVAERLRLLSGTTRPLVASRLRGGFLRGDQWGRLPSQPAVITSTVDQLGSRLLFRGYGRSARTAPIWAGLAANDSLILLDEAHCSVPFLQTLLLIERYRGEQWAEQPLRTPFAFTILSATPPEKLLEDATRADVFPGPDREKALDHPKLQERLSASKPAELAKPSRSHEALVQDAAEQARQFVKGRHRVAVIVNRVRTAAEIAKKLNEKADETFDIYLLTGRMRPYDRDKLTGSLTPFLRAGNPEDPQKPIILVSTQCIEVGADFSFDAMVTEAASLDALRQRFGRLNRMGLPGPAPAVILIRQEDTKEKKQEDPVYGAALHHCWDLLQVLATAEGEGRAERHILDFGVNALDALLASVDSEVISQALAPHPDAPVLLPAHLDLLCQTSPPPAVEPDVALYLHGVGRSAPEARVVWRADLDEDSPDLWVETVALCPPTPAEMLPVPLHRLRRWLSEASTEGLGDADVEGQAADDPERIGWMRRAVLWRGRDRSKLTTNARNIVPDDIVVLPGGYGIEGLAPDVEQLDIWEASRLLVDQGAAVRIHAEVLKPWLDAPEIRELVELAQSDDWEAEAVDEQIQVVLDSQSDSVVLPDEWRTALSACYGGRIEQHPSQGLILFAKKQKEAIELDTFADDDDLRSLSDEEIPLAQHCIEVARAADRLAGNCLPEGSQTPIRDAALWHDAGKLDSRFQTLLRQGDELHAAAHNPIAKSLFIPTSPARRKAIREATGLPEGFRHEMLSAELADRFQSFGDEDRNLTLHLIASHHGHARPFAPIAQDRHPPGVAGEHLGIPINLPAEVRELFVPCYQVDSGISERFWRLNRRYGWWGLAYLEAVVRLSDWYASEYRGKIQEPCPVVRSTGPTISSSPRSNAEIVLSGLDGANPLGFLAALGTLVTLQQGGCADLRMHWRRSAVWQPVLTGRGDVSLSEICQRIADNLRGEPVSGIAEADRREAQVEFEAAKKELRDAIEEVKAKKLRRNDRKTALEDLTPLRQTLSDKRTAWLRALKKAVPRPELALGKQINCTPVEYRCDHALALVSESRLDSREPIDLLAAFASDGCVDKHGVVSSTPFCFITGSGHQYFLDTARLLMDAATPERVRLAILSPWRYEDEKLSMRWDPAEDRRYALLDRDPTASDNKSRTVWMANLLGYRALALFASAPTPRGLETTGWSSNGEGTRFSWPVWVKPLDLESIRSVLLLGELQARSPDHHALRQIGIDAVFRARRIQVGNPPLYKINFSPAVEV